MIVDPSLYGRKVRHSHIDSREQGLLRGIHVEASSENYNAGDPVILVERTNKGKGQLVLWRLGECELEEAQ